MTVDLEAAPVPARTTGPRATSFWATVLLLVLTGLWRLSAATQWSWTQDDWVYVMRAHEMPFGEYVLQDYTGHLMPGQFAFVWVITHLAPLDYAWAVAGTWTLGMTSLVVWAVLLRRLLGPRWAAVVPLVPLALASGFVPITLWMAAALQTFSLQLFLGLALLASLGWTERGRRRSLLLTAAAFVGGLLFWEKALLIVIPVLGLTLLLARDTSGRLLRRRLATMATVLAVPAVAYLVVYRALTSGSGQAAEVGIPRTLPEAVSFFWTAVVQHLLPGAVGGPWNQPLTPTSSAAVPTTWVQWMLVAAALAGVGWAVQRRARAWIPLSTALVYAIVSLGLVLTSVRYDAVGATIALDPRYEADVLAVCLLMGTLLVVPARSEHGVLRSQAAPRRLPAWAAPAVGVALLVSCLFSSSTLWDSYRPSSPKPWVDAIVPETQAVGAASVFDSRPPGNVMAAALFPDDAYLSRMLSPLELRVGWNAPTTRMLAAADNGLLVVANFGNSVRSLPGPVRGCGYLIQPGQRVQIPLSGPTIDWDWGVVVSGFSRDGGGLVLRTDHTETTLPVGRGLGSSQAIVSDGFRSLSLEGAAGSGAICVDTVTVGLVSPGSTPR